ncbi:hypothetical protein SESBI_31078 [Sesbania bispinosa]|nr:hypothetical protein SESBI_31078 [Sesbania bispinosa]
MNMKLSTKPISSPGRTDKFPPPLMRFLRTNAGNRSRGRSRSSSMFLRKKNTAIETQEPSSPKVTCMGQVRVRRSSKQATAKKGRPSSSSAGDGAPTTCRCCWYNNEEDSEQEETERENRVNAFVSNCSSSTPPRNALLLTRCRSAPYRSSSLASRFWGSPLRNEETELENREPSEKQRPNESISEQEGVKDPKLELKLRFSKNLKIHLGKEYSSQKSS